MKSVFGVIVGNRGFFPDVLVNEGREEILKVLEENDCEAVLLGTGDTELGAVVTLEDAKKCAKLFNENAGRIDGIILTLPNFGEERGIADTMKMLDFQVPVLVQASPDDPKRVDISRRRDSFCGKISACSNLLQYNVPFTLTESHTVALSSDEFKRDLERFKGICRVVKGMRRARIGAIGARPAAFNTVRYSEKILAGHGITVETIDLSEIYGQMDALKESEADVQAKIKDIGNYVETGNTPAAAITKMAKLGVVVDRFIAENDLDATAVQCWTSMEEYFGVVPCTVMSMLSNGLKPSACEVDVTGALSMYALQLASGEPSALLDWNNNFADDPDKCVLFHCSNLPKAFFKDMRMDYQEIIAGAVGKENTYGTCVGRIKEGPLTYARFTTVDTTGDLMCYVGEGEFTADKLDTFGGFGVAEIPGLQDLLKFICMGGFEHHVAVNLSRTADILTEAFTKYLGIDTYHHGSHEQ
ncbi:MAG: L-fucose/L-arabinose isomerase family protein [Spirochaetia bacterium]